MFWRITPSLLSLYVFVTTLIKKFKGSFRSYTVIFERKVTER